MTKAELITGLSNWPDKANISLYLVKAGEVVEFPLEYVESLSDSNDIYDCHLYGGDL